MSDHLSERHLALSECPTLSVHDRYRQLAAYHVVSLDFRRAIQAMWASVSDLDAFLPLEALAESFRGRTSPLWLTSSGEAARFPSSEMADWQDIETLGAQHADISSMAISDRVRAIHGAAAYILLGQYGFAIQCLKSSASSADGISLESLAMGNVTVNERPAWVDCWQSDETLK